MQLDCRKVTITCINHAFLSQFKKKLFGAEAKVSAVHSVPQSHEIVFLIQLDAFIQTTNDFKSQRELLACHWTFPETKS